MLPEVARGTLDGIGEMDHSVSSEYRLLGPPGTGKTTNTGKLVRRAAEKYGSHAILVTSFSRAAAAELADCDLPIGPDQLGTLHSICYHAMERPRIAEAHVDGWNRSYPQWSLTSANWRTRLDGDDSVEEAGNRRGDSILQAVNRCRGLMLERDLWPAPVREFERAWTAYKRDAALLDFTDLIEGCLRDVHMAPGRPAVIFADEAQDLNVMQGRLLRSWGQHVEYSVLAGDDDQAIYSFLGAAPEVLLEPALPADHTVVLRQSHRVPSSVHAAATSLIHRVTRRHDKAYLPRVEEGAVHRLSSGSYKTPEYFIMSSAVKHLERGKKIMFLASCSYMLQPIIQVLRKNAIPFHNPYRGANGFWNPLRMGPRTAALRIQSLLLAHPQYGEGQHPWTNGDLLLWTEWLTDILTPGGRELLAASDRRQTPTVDELSALFRSDHFPSLLATFDVNWRSLLEWWRHRAGSDVRGRVQFPADIVSKHGPQTLLEEPSVIVGTIHSVKGGQADVVYLFPDLSRAGNAQYQRPGADRDSIIRLLYVGATRARETLYICQPDTAMAVRI